MGVMTFEATEEEVLGMDRRARALGMSRDGYLRWLVDGALAGEGTGQA